MIKHMYNTGRDEEAIRVNRKQIRAVRACLKLRPGTIVALSTSKKLVHVAGWMPHTAVTKTLVTRRFYAAHQH